MSYSSSQESQESQDLTQILSEVHDLDRQANNPYTREFLEAGKRLLRHDLLRNAGEAAAAKGQPPFEEVLAWLTYKRVVSEAQREDPRLTLAALRYRWRNKVGYLRDLVISVLSPRMERPNSIDYASQVIREVAEDGRSLADAVADIAAAEVRILKEDHAFRLQMIFQATLAHDSQVADTLGRIDKANIDAWTVFLEQSFNALGVKIRDDLDFTQLSQILHVAGQGVIFRSMLPARPGTPATVPTDLLPLIAKAMIVATIDLGDGKTLDDFLDEIIERRRPV